MEYYEMNPDELRKLRRIARNLKIREDKLKDVTDWINPKICLPDSGEANDRNIVEIKAVYGDDDDVEERYIAYYDVEAEIWKDISGTYRFHNDLVVGWRKLIP